MLQASGASRWTSSRVSLQNNNDNDDNDDNNNNGDGGNAGAVVSWCGFFNMACVLSDGRLVCVCVSQSWTFGRK